MYPVTVRSSTAGLASDASDGKETENSFVPVLM